MLIDKDKVFMWKDFLESRKSLIANSLSEIEFDALSTCVEDSYESFCEIYNQLIPELEESRRNKDIDKMQTCVIEIYMAFMHIESHISDAEKGFLELSNCFENNNDKPGTHTI